MCGLDYYEELKTLILENATDRKESGTCSVITKYKGLEVWMSYETQNDRMYVICSEEGDWAFDAFMLFIDKASVKNWEYDWELSDGWGTGQSGEISGQLEAEDFSNSTSALKYDNSTFKSSDTAEKQAQVAASRLEIAIVHGFKVLLQKSNNKISPYHYGFEHFE